MIAKPVPYFHAAMPLKFSILTGMDKTQAQYSLVFHH